MHCNFEKNTHIYMCVYVHIKFSHIHHLISYGNCLCYTDHGSKLGQPSYISHPLGNYVEYLGLLEVPASHSPPDTVSDSLPVRKLPDAHYDLTNLFHISTAWSVINVLISLLVTAVQVSHTSVPREIMRFTLRRLFLVPKTVKP